MNTLKRFLGIRNGGLAIYGGIIGGTLAAIVYTRIKKLNLFKFTDTLVFGLLCGQIFGRWGNFVNREAFGSFTDSLFALAYKASTVAGLKINGSEGAYNGTLYPITEIGGESYIQVHPTFCMKVCVIYVSLYFYFSIERRKIIMES